MALSAKDQQAIAAMIAAAMNPPATPAAKAVKPAAKRTRKNATATAARKPAAKRSTPACITAGQAWIALGGAAEFEPRDLDKPANNAQLWKLNAAGLISLAQ